MTQYRDYSEKFKAAAVGRMKAGESPSELARTLNVPRKALYNWRDAVLDGRPLRTRGRPKKRAETETAADTAARVKELEQLVGQLTLENRFFKGALQRIRELRQPNGEAGATASSRKSRP